MQNLLTFFCTFILSRGLRSLKSNFKMRVFRCGKVGTSLFSCGHIKVGVLEVRPHKSGGVKETAMPIKPHRDLI